MNNNIPQSPSSSQLPPPPPPPSSSIPSTPIHHSSSSPPPSPTPTPTPTNPKTPRLLTIPVSQTTQYSSLSSPAGDISQQQQQQQHHSEGISKFQVCSDFNNSNKKDYFKSQSIHFLRKEVPH
jgi:hypothetical protein